MNIFGTQEQQSRKIKELIIRQQLKNLLPLDIKNIDIVFCAHELNKQVNGYRFDVNFKKN
tara:strand:- start:349 stop:528 length:180 start_codon:yes stop_codon:yes gene_type:complete